METFNNYTQIIPTSTEVVNYFINNGSTQEQALIWFNYQDRMFWRDKKGKKILKWERIAYLRIGDLKSNVVNKTISKPKTKKDNCLIIAENFGSLYKQQTGILPSVYNKCVYELILAYKDKYGFTDDIELCRSITELMSDCSDWEFDSVKSYLK